MDTAIGFKVFRFLRLNNNTVLIHFFKYLEQYFWLKRFMLHRITVIGPVGINVFQVLSRFNFEAL